MTAVLRNCAMTADLLF